MSVQPVVSAASYCLAHAPELVRYGSKPRREIAKDPAFEQRLAAALRSFPAAAHYPPNQTFVGNLTPEVLAGIPRPWYARTREGNERGLINGRFGEIVDQAAFYGLLKRADVLEPPLVEVNAAAGARITNSLTEHPALHGLAPRELRPLSGGMLRQELDTGPALPLMLDGDIAGLMRRDERAEGREDDNLSASTLLEGLCAKATGALALHCLLERTGLEAESIDYVISCGEEAAGDRYQRGGGGIAKAIGEMCGCLNASGMDVKNFCAAPASALITAGALVAAGVYVRVAVVAGGSLAKLGMKSEAFIAVLEPIAPSPGRAPSSFTVG